MIDENEDDGSCGHCGPCEYGSCGQRDRYDSDEDIDESINDEEVNGEW